MFICTYICIRLCIFTLKPSLHSNPYPVTLRWHRLLGALRCRLLFSVEWTNSNRNILMKCKDLWISPFPSKGAAARRDHQERPSLTGQRATSSEQLRVKKIVVWETAVLASQISQAPWRVAVCSWEAAGPHLNSLGRKAGPRKTAGREWFLEATSLLESTR